MITGTAFWEAARCFLSSMPLIPGLWISVIPTQGTPRRIPSRELRSQRTYATTARRMDSSSMMEIRDPAGTRRPFPKISPRMRAEDLRPAFAYARAPGNHTHVLFGYAYAHFGFQSSAMRTRSASIRGAPILHCSGAMNFHRYRAQAQVTGQPDLATQNCSKFKGP